MAKSAWGKKGEDVYVVNTRGAGKAADESAPIFPRVVTPELIMHRGGLSSLSRGKVKDRWEGGRKAIIRGRTSK